MPNRASKKRNAAKKRGGRAPKPTGGGPRSSMPARASIIGEAEFTSPRPGGRKYRVIETNEVDRYEPMGPKPGVLSPAFIAAKPLPTGDAYRGHDRRAAKLSIAKAPVERFADVKELLATLPAVSVMKQHKPPIKTDKKSRRVAEERRNVRVRAFLYAASRESDNDFHLIIGRSTRARRPVYMTMEISGLPPARSASFARLKAARKAYKNFFGAALPGFGYKFYRPPVPVEIEGSLFFDATHARGEPPGPQTLRRDMPTIWEVHPVTRIVFEP
ncbi:MAG TPA: hypothetical protein VF546_00130 [Pyrinomonadaceae bacterium]|jgi:hypothetical protein